MEWDDEIVLKKSDVKVWKMEEKNPEHVAHENLFDV